MTTPRFTARAENILARATAIAEEREHNAIGVEYIMLAILDEGQSMAAAAIRATSATEGIRAFLDEHMQASGYSPHRAPQ